MVFNPPVNVATKKIHRRVQSKIVEFLIVSTNAFQLYFKTHTIIPSVDENDIVDYKNNGQWPTVVS